MYGLQSRLLGDPQKTLHVKNTHLCGEKLTCFLVKRVLLRKLHVGFRLGWTAGGVLCRLGGEAGRDGRADAAGTDAQGLWTARRGPARRQAGRTPGQRRTGSAVGPASPTGTCGHLHDLVQPPLPA